MTNERELLELVAKAMGGRFELENGFPHLNGNFWNPLASQDDSADLRNALEIDVVYFRSPPMVVCSAWSADDENHFEEAVSHNGTQEDRSRAVREARLMVAAENGRNKE